jgi:hypothetical protein
MVPWLDRACALVSIGVSGYDEQQKALFVTLVERTPRFEAYTEASFSPGSIDLLYLRVAQVPRS